MTYDPRMAPLLALRRLIDLPESDDGNRKRIQRIKIMEAMTAEEKEPKE